MAYYSTPPHPESSGLGTTQPSSSSNEKSDPDSGVIKRDLSDGEKRFLSSLQGIFLSQEVIDSIHPMDSGHLPETIDSLLALFQQVSTSCASAMKEHKVKKEEEQHGQPSKKLPPRPDAVTLANGVKNSLAQEWMGEARSLCSLLSTPHLLDLLKAYDTITRAVEYSGHPDSSPSDQVHHEYDLVPCPSRQSSHRPVSSSARLYHEVLATQPIYMSIDSHLPTISVRHHHYEFLEGASTTVATDEADRPSSSILDPHFFVKQIQIVKGGEPLGITVKPLDNGQGAVIVTRVLYGGAAHRSGLVSPGDIIFQVNDIPLKGKTLLSALQLLERESRKESISFRLLINDLNTAGTDLRRSNNNILPRSDLLTSSLFLRSFFDYNPLLDREHPCPEGGLLFKKGDVLEVVSREDDNWWQARHEEDLDYSCRAGIVPSPELQEKRVAALRDLTRQRYLSKSVEIIPGIKSPIKKATWSHRVKKVMYRVNDTEEFEDNDLPTYEEVILLYPSQGFCRPIVIFGADLIGRNKMIRRLLQRDKETYRTPIAHTTRPPRPHELDGAEYYFVTKEWFLNEVKAGSLVEYEQYKENMYGIHRESIREIIASGAICLLSLRPQGLKAVRNSVFKPFVIFLKPDATVLTRCLECHERRAKSNEYIVEENQDSRLLTRLQRDAIERKSFKPESIYGTSDMGEYGTYGNTSIASFPRKVKRNHLKHLTDEEKRQLLYESSRLEYLYGHYFDVILLVEDDLIDVVNQLVQVIRSVQLLPQWTPASWL